MYNKLCSFICYSIIRIFNCSAGAEKPVKSDQNMAQND